MLNIINKSSTEEFVKSVEDLTDTLKGLTKIIHEENNKDKLPWNILMVKKIVDLELSVRALNCLKKENIVYVGDLVQKKEYELLRIRDFGRKSLREIKKILNTMGLKLGVKLKQWDTDTISKALNLLEEDPKMDQIIKQVNLYQDLSKKIDNIGDPIYTNNKNWICSIYTDSGELILEFNYNDDIDNLYITSKFDYEKVLKEFNINTSTIKSWYIINSFRS